MVRMRILGLSVDSKAKTPILLLQTEDEKRVLPIWIGSMEAMSISLALSGQNTPRPLTHDLLLSIVQILNANLESIEISSFSGGIFYAELVFKHNNEAMRVDCRPSDGIAIAIKTGIPIYVSNDVLDSAKGAQQKQDATSFQTLKPDVEVDRKKFETSQKLHKNMPHITIKMPPKLNVKTLTKPISLQDGSVDLAALLRSLDPPSTKKM